MKLIEEEKIRDEVRSVVARRRVLVELKLATAMAKGKDKKILAKALEKYKKDNREVIKKSHR